MKTVKFAKKWRNPVNETTVHEYPTGWSGDVSDQIAKRAQAAKVLEGEPVNAPEPKAVEKPAEA